MPQWICRLLSDKNITSKVLNHFFGTVFFFSASDSWLLYFCWLSSKLYEVIMLFLACPHRPDNGLQTQGTLRSVSRGGSIWLRYAAVQHKTYGVRHMWVHFVCAIYTVSELNGYNNYTYLLWSCIAEDLVSLQHDSISCSVSAVSEKINYAITALNWSTVLLEKSRVTLGFKGKVTNYPLFV